MIKFFNWFKKKQKQVGNTTSNLNGLYTARLEDLRTITKKISDLDNKIDNLPPIPDMSDYASKSQENTFTARNKFTDNVGFNNFPSKEGAGSFEPTLNKQFTTKYYVDKKISESIDAIPPLDLSNLATKQELTDATSNVAKTNLNNNFTGNNSFGSITTDNGSISDLTTDGITTRTLSINNRGRIDNEPVEVNDIVNKQYVDNKFNSINKNITTYRFSGVSNDYCNVTKQVAANGGIFFYKGDGRASIIFDYGSIPKGKYFCILTFTKIMSTDKRTESLCNVTLTQFIDVISNTNIGFKPKMLIPTWVDLYYGAANNTEFRAYFEYELTMIKVS